MPGDKTARLSAIGATEILLTEGWNLALTEPGAWATRADMAANAGFLPAPVPGTVAEALEQAGLFDRAAPQPLDNRDAWYLCRLVDIDAGAAVLRFAGLATIAEVYLNGTLILQAHSMFEAHDVAVSLAGGDELAICFRALGPHLDASGPRARWRPQMMDTQGLRMLRTTALGRMPGWCPPVHAVGPFRPVSLIRPGAFRISDLTIVSQLGDGGDGILTVSCLIEGVPDGLRLACGGLEQPFQIEADGRFSARLTLPGVTPWWPRSHGEPTLYDVTLMIDGAEHALGATGFRTIVAERGAAEPGTDGQDFAIVVNGEPVFCRGAVWTSADIVRLPGDRAAYEPWLRLAAEAGMNMIRIGGTMTYETPEFYRLCDELGLMVWQEFMLANFDYPVKDAGFVADVTAEAEQLLRAVQASPSLAVLCGGSEIYQQAAMMGLPERIWKGPLTEEILPAVCRRLRPDVPYVANSPSGGAMPFSPNAGVTHYYGVGAYCRPLDDARRANVRFAAESLAFAHVPEQPVLDKHLPVPAVQHPRWKARVPRDRSASWDFEDIREHYLGDLYGVDPARLRREDPIRYLDMSRAVTGEVIEATYGEWRRPQSPCNGALVWTLQDLLPGPGWGVIDATGTPKPVWHALKRAFRPLQVLLSDEGTNGLDAHVINETDAPRALVLELSCLRAGQQPVVSGRMEVSLAARQSRTIAATDLFGAFFDTTYAFRFGPPSHDVTVARLLGEDGVVVAEAFHFPLGRAEAFHDARIEASLSRSEDGGWFLDLSTDRLAQAVSILCDGYRPSDNWFHLAPGKSRRIALLALPETDTTTLPSGEIRHIGSPATARF